MPLDHKDVFFIHSLRRQFANGWVLARLVAGKGELEGNFEASFFHRTERCSISAFDFKPLLAIGNRARRISFVSLSVAMPHR
jgi:hypothetical protein